MPDKTLEAFADHGKVGDPMPEDGGDAEQVMQAHRDAGVDTDALALKLQKDGADAFVKSWTELLDTIRVRVRAPGSRKTLARPSGLAMTGMRLRRVVRLRR